MKKILLGACLLCLSSQLLATPRVKIFRAQYVCNLEEQINNFIYNNRKTIQIKDIKYQADAKFHSVGGNDRKNTMTAMLIYDSNL